MEQSNFGEYPTAQFPSEYTKQGQAQLMQKFLNRQNNESVITQTVQTQSTPENVDTMSNETQSTFDIHKLMPLIKSMSQNKALSKNELIKMMLPMLSGSNSDYNEILSMMLDKKTQIVDTMDLQIEENSTAQKIDSYRRVEN